MPCNLLITRYLRKSSLALRVHLPSKEASAVSNRMFGLHRPDVIDAEVSLADRTLRELVRGKNNAQEAEKSNTEIVGFTPL